MKVKMYYIYDRIAGCYSQPKGYSNEAIAKRAIQHELREHPYKSDLDVMEGHTFDMVEGTVTDVPCYPKFVCHVTDLYLKEKTTPEGGVNGE